jgi:hypothetical protein
MMVRLAHHPGSLRYTTRYSLGPIGLPSDGRHGFTSLMQTTVTIHIFKFTHNTRQLLWSGGGTGKILFHDPDLWPLVFLY